jgi:hypothetical protein
MSFAIVVFFLPLEAMLFSFVAAGGRGGHFEPGVR